jgi:hypothetical protein
MRDSGVSPGHIGAYGFGTLARTDPEVASNVVSDWDATKRRLPPILTAKSGDVSAGKRPVTAPLTRLRDKTLDGVKTHAFDWVLAAWPKAALHKPVVIAIELKSIERPRGRPKNLRVITSLLLRRLLPRSNRCQNAPNSKFKPL